MTNTTKALLAFVGAVIIGGFIWGGYLYPLQQANTQGVGSPAGTTFNSAKVAAINISPQNRTSTSTSLFNGDASDREVTDAFVSCAGVTSVFDANPQTTGVATWNWTAATSTVAAPTASIAAAGLAAMQVTVATSTGDAYTATSTYTAAASRRWNAGTYMVFQTNATSSTAVCQAGVHYLGL